MAFPLSPSGGLLTRLRAELQGDLDAAKLDIQQKLGSVVTELPEKMSTVDDALRKLESAGQALFEKMDVEKAETVTKLQSIMADAGSEFEKHKSVINQVAEHVQTTKKGHCSNGNGTSRGTGRD